MARKTAQEPSKANDQHELTQQDEPAQQHEPSQQSKPAQQHEPSQQSKPTKRKKGHAERRARILNAAHTVIQQRGYERASLRAIAREAGFSPAGVYEYFDGREALLEALSLEASARLQARLSAALADQTGWASDRLVRLGLSYLAFARERPEDFALLFSEHSGVTLTLDPSAPSPEIARAPLAALVEVATAGLVSGELDPLFSAKEIAWGIWALAHGAASLRLLGIPKEPDTSEAWALRAYVDGLSRYS